MTEHLGHEKNPAETDRVSTHVRNGMRARPVVSDAAGEAEISVMLGPRIVAVGSCAGAGCDPSGTSGEADYAVPQAEAHRQGAMWMSLSAG